jgi:hypothetical protein
MNKNKTPKEVVRAIRVLSDYIENTRSTDQAAINIALASDREKCAELASIFKNAEMRFRTGKVKTSYDERFTFGQALGAERR